jgi:putative oxidoreductase
MGADVESGGGAQAHRSDRGRAGLRPRDALLLAPLAQGGDAALLIARLLCGAFLIHGVWDNVTSAARMAEFVAFLTATGLAWPELMAPLSVYAQLAIGLLLVPGALTRWAGLLLTFNFVVAEIMVHWGQSFREQWPALALIAFGLLFATVGAGRWSLDRFLDAKRAG